YEILTGRRLFEGATVSDTLAAVLRNQPDLDAAPPRVRRLLGVCLVKDPRQRLGHINGARFVLEETQANGLRHGRSSRANHASGPTNGSIIQAIRILIWRRTESASRCSRYRNPRLATRAPFMSRSC